MSCIVLILAIFLAMRFIKPNPQKGKMHSLYFLLSGFTALIALTIFAFMLFNWINTKPVQLSKSAITIGGESFALNKIRRTQVHREGNGIPFQGIGVDKGTNNSLLIEMSDGEVKILSEDFYPITEIANKIKENKKGAK